jgi:hypothetical protein
MPASPFPFGLALQGGEHRPSCTASLCASRRDGTTPANAGVYLNLTTSLIECWQRGHSKVRRSWSRVSGST